MANFKSSYVATLPLQGDAPNLTITNNDRPLIVKFFDKDRFIAAGPVTTGTITAAKQYFHNWRIEVWDQDNLVYQEAFDLKDKTVFIKFDAYALGDNIAWIPYVEEFRQKHQCNVICSTFHNALFETVYPNIMFVAPNTRIANVYAQYYIGTMNRINPCYSPSCYLDNPLQKVAADILGLEYKEIRPRIAIPPHQRPARNRYVCLSEYTSLRVKDWCVPGGWQGVANLFRERGYDVVTISKEPSYLKYTINKSGDYPLSERITDLLYADYYIGSSSGLAWLAWSLGVHVFLVSDFTPPYHEFQSNVTRIHHPESRKEISYSEPQNIVSLDNVLGQIQGRLIS